MKNWTTGVLAWHILNQSRLGFQAGYSSRKDKRVKDQAKRLQKLRPSSEFPEVQEAWEDGFKKGWDSREKETIKKAA